MNIQYRVNAAVTTAQFLDLLEASGLAGRRPVEDLECMAGMLANADLLVTAWEGDLLVGIARSITDFHYACYLADLAVCESHQRTGIGKALLSVTQQSLGSKCKIILLAAPDANAYYARLGFTANPRGWVLERDTIMDGP